MFWKRKLVKWLEEEGNKARKARDSVTDNTQYTWYMGYIAAIESVILHVIAKL